MDFHAVVAAVRSIRKAKLIVIVNAENAVTERYSQHCFSWHEDASVESFLHDIQIND